LLTRKLIRPFFNGFSQGTLGDQRIAELAAHGGSVPLQGSKSDVASGLSAFGIDDGCLGDTDGLGELSGRHTECLPYGMQPALSGSRARKGTPLVQCRVELMEGEGAEHGSMSSYMLTDSVYLKRYS
jgi:hypothetical protein